MRPHVRVPSDAQRLTTTELRDVQIDLLQRFDAFCSEHDLTYLVCAGTLLGAVRHGGYIPWDDDIDVMVPRPHYERLLSLADEVAESTGAKLRYSEGVADKYPYPFAKLCQPRTLMIEGHDAAVAFGVNIDIFPMDGWPSRTLVANMHRSIIRGLIHALGVRARKSGRTASTSLFAGALRLLTAPISTGRLVRWIGKVAQRSNSTSSSALLGVAVWGYHERVPREFVLPPSAVSFEQHEFPAPAAPRRVLEVVYGDYMRLPPESQRITHHDFSAYRLS